MAITYKEEFNLNDLIFSDVIDGLNEYFDDGETHKSFVEIKCYNEVLFYRFDAEIYLDKLITWLRTEHGIFYYPGMDAKYAKTERIPPLTERLMDEGALDSLKKLYKRVVGKETILDSPTLIADDILHGISRAVSVKDAQIVELQTQMEKQANEIRILKKECDRLNEKDIMDHIRQEASRNGYNLPEKVNGDPLTIERVFHDLLELLRKRGEELRTLESKCNRLDEIVEELNTLNNEIKEDLP